MAEETESVAVGTEPDQVKIEKDLFEGKLNPDDWYKHVYRGGMPQLTWRAVLMGGVLGMAMSVSNLYTTLKLGWGFGVAITACVLSFAVSTIFVKLGWAKTKLSLLENNCMQSTASAAGYSTGGTLATAVGALLLISGDENRLGWETVVIWVFLVAVLGVILAIPMKRQMINTEQLRFPSGIAAATTLKSLYAQGEEAVHKARALIGALAAGVIVGAPRILEWIPGEFRSAVNLFTVRGTTWKANQLYGLHLEPSLLLIAAGMLVGMRVSLSMLAGSLINYLVLTPYILNLPDWAQAGKTFIGHFQIGHQEPFGDIVKVTGWSLWLGTSIMVFSGLAAFALSWRTIVRALRGFGRKGTGNTGDAMRADIEVPVTWMAAGGIPVTIGLMALCYFSFGIAPWLGLVAVALSFVLSLVACRATGETDTTPVGPMGKITQFIFAVLAPADKTANLMSAGITGGAASSSADLLTDLKSGYLLGANPRKQFLAQFFGTFFGVIAVVPAWYLLVPNKAALEGFNPPATNMWYAVAEALSSGVGIIPVSARYAIVAGGLVGILLPVLGAIFPRLQKWLPSAMGLGLAFVVSFANSFAFFVGALIAWVWSRYWSKSGDRYIIPLASGAVAGESLALAGAAIFQNLKALVTGG